MTDTYELPRTESGEVDWEQISEMTWNGVLDCAPYDHLTLFTTHATQMLKAIDANARKEERERCAKVADTLPGDFDRRWGDCDPATPHQIATAIRNLEDKP